MSYKLAIFDLDGTLLDTLDDLADAVNHALNVYSLPLRTRDEVCSFIGNGARMLIIHAVGENADADTTLAVFSEFSTYYKTHGDIKTKPYDGVIDMLNKLKASGVKLAMLSNKPDHAVQILNKQYFGDIFDFAAGERAGVPRKPAPDAINAILADFNVSAAESVYIGDSDVDVDVAKNADMNCISVSWGFRDADFLREHGATCIVSSTDALFDEITK